MSVHYVTHLKVERVSHNPGRPATSFIDTRSPADRPSREVAEIGSVTVKAKTLDELAKKIGGHLALFDDEPIDGAL